MQKSLNFKIMQKSTSFKVTVWGDNPHAWDFSNESLHFQADSQARLFAVSIKEAYEKSLRKLSVTGTNRSAKQEAYKLQKLSDLGYSKTGGDNDETIIAPFGTVKWTYIKSQMGNSNFADTDKSYYAFEVTYETQKAFSILRKDNGRLDTLISIYNDIEKAQYYLTKVEPRGLITFEVVELQENEALFYYNEGNEYFHTIKHKAMFSKGNSLGRNGAFQAEWEYSRQNLPKLG